MRLQLPLPRSHPAKPLVGQTVPDRSARADVAGDDALWVRRDEAIMGTAIHVELWCADAALARHATDAVIAEMHRIDRLMSPFKPTSELSCVNRDAATRAVPVSAELFALIERSLHFSRLSDGAFDITFAAVGSLYDYRAGVAPDAATLERARRAIGWRHLVLDPAQHSVRFAREGMRIDLGGFAKGYAVDTSIAILKRLGIAHAVVAAGGDSHVLGDRRGRPWSIAVRDPRDAQRIVAVLPLRDTSISTSGDYERFFERDGVRHHHLIDPKTGVSPSAVHSVTILANDGLTSEGISKCVFVMDLPRGMRLVESLPGVDAVVVDAAGALHVSTGLAAASGAPGGVTRQ
ncbi:MAG: FAD:protein FMN transferase [Ideonella sp.]|nr:FAD:protein FMN transferase [Ideonella sp.]MCC7458962.1 FAD:protein FMN transferase [Nitrospira sp.]